MDPFVDLFAALFRAAAAIQRQLDESGHGWITWALLFVLSVYLGARHVIAHMRRGRIVVGGELLGTRHHTDAFGASLFRSAAKVERKPSLSPFAGRAVAWRAVPYPAAVVALWMYVYTPWLLGTLTAGLGAWMGWHAWRTLSTWQHRRAIVRPMARALAPALQERADVILSGIVVPKDYAEDHAEVVIPLPDDHRPMHIQEASRIVHERLGGEWRHVRSPQAPYVLTFRHKPAPPSYVAYEDVAELLLTGGDIWTPFIGLGTERDSVRLNFDGHVVHLGISAGTGAGKSTLMRLMAVQFALYSGGAARQIYIDVKGDDEGMTSIPGMVVLNDIGTLDGLEGLPRMWQAIRWVASELDARRRGLRGPKEAWEPIILYNDEQNMFADYTSTAWDMMRDKDDPKTAPVWQDMRMIGFMGRSFKIRMVNAYQVFSAAAAGGGNAQRGAELRRQFGNLMLARFNPSMWDNLVGTRPRGQSSDIPGRWLHVNNAGLARAVQLPQFEPQHVVDLLTYAGFEVPTIGGPSHTPVPSGSSGASHEIPAGPGDWGTGDPAGPAAGPADPLPDNVREFRPRSQNASQNPAEPRYTLKEACQQGIIPVTYEAARKARQRARTRGEWFPPGEDSPRGETYTAEELITFYVDSRETAP